MENQEEKNLPTILNADLQKAMLGYEMAIQLWAAEIQNRMSHYNAMLVANSVILAAVGFSYQTINFLLPIRFFLAALGILLCLVWYMSEKRAIEKAVFWLLSAREIEEKYFVDVFATLNRSVFFRRGNAIEFFLGGTTRPRKMRFWGRILKSQSAFSFIILLFVIMYVSVPVVELVYR